MKSDHLGHALDTLNEMNQSVAGILPELIEPFQVLSTSDTLGNKAELTIMAHCAYARAATVKLRLMELIYRQLCGACVEVVD